MVGVHDVLKGADGAGEQRERLVIVPSFLANESEVGQRWGEIGMLRTQDVLLDGQRPPVELLRLREITAPVLDGGEVVEADGHLVVVRAEGALEGREGVAQQPFGFVDSAEGVQDGAESGLVRRDIEVVGAEGPLADLDRPSGRRLGRREVTAGMCQSPQVVIDARDVRVIWT